MNEDLINRITYHLSSGGLFNPELADHLAVRNLLMECREALAQTEQEPVALQRDVIVVNLVREGINKHRARELAEHFSKHTTPPQRTWVGLTDEEVAILASHELWVKTFIRKIEEMLRSKNT